MNIPSHILEKMGAADFILGADEVGVGSWAGPMCTGAVIVPRYWKMPGLTDSKKLTPKKREYLRAKLLDDPQVVHCLIQVNSDVLDAKGMGKALREAHLEAIEGVLALHQSYGLSQNIFAIIDGVNASSIAIPLPKADLLIQAVSAASVLAKTLHDEEMQRLSKLYPGYGWETNQGYASKVHIAALNTLGVSPVHRMSYQPMKSMRKPVQVSNDDPFAELFDFEGNNG